MLIIQAAVWVSAQEQDNRVLDSYFSGTQLYFFRITLLRYVGPMLSAVWWWWSLSSLQVALGSQVNSSAPFSLTALS